MSFFFTGGTVNVSGEVSIESPYNGAIVKVQETAGTATQREDSYTVPANKIWKLKFGTIYRANTGLGSFEITASGTRVIVNSFATTLYANILFNDILLAAGDIVHISAATGTSGSILTSLGYEEYDA